MVSANEVRFTPADLLAWNDVTLPDVTGTEAFTRQIKLGMFGYDLDHFWTDCALTTNCDGSTLATYYDGFAIGSYMILSLSA